MNRTASRFGGSDAAPAAATSAPKTGIDSSHGSAIATPAPRRSVRRDSWYCRALLPESLVIDLFLGHFGCSSLIQELRTRHDRFDDIVNAVAVGLELCADVGNEQIIRW